MANMKLGSLKADLAKEAEGIWIDSAQLDGVRFKVSSLYTPAYVTALSLTHARLARKYRKKPVPPEELFRESGTLYAEHILHDWQGLDTEYTPELARDLLTNPEFRLLVQAVEEAAADASQINVEHDEETEKNSGKRSATS